MDDLWFRGTSVSGSLHMGIHLGILGLNITGCNGLCNINMPIRNLWFWLGFSIVGFYHRDTVWDRPRHIKRKKNGGCDGFEHRQYHLTCDVSDFENQLPQDWDEIRLCGNHPNAAEDATLWLIDGFCSVDFTPFLWNFEQQKHTATSEWLQGYFLQSVVKYKIVQFAYRNIIL